MRKPAIPGIKVEVHLIIRDEVDSWLVEPLTTFVTIKSDTSSFQGLRNYKMSHL